MVVAQPGVRFTKVQPAAPAKPAPEPEAEPQPEEPPSLEAVFRKKPEAKADTPSFGYESEESSGTNRWTWPVVIAAIIVVVGVYFLVIRPNRQPAEPGAAVSTEAPAHRQAIALALRAEGSDAGLTIFWDGHAAPISTAPRGVLSIRDGAGTKNIDLTSDELKKGSYDYEPRTDDVLIRLELKGLPGNQLAYGGTRVLGARRLSKPGK